MWPSDLFHALSKILDIYGYRCCIERIHHNMIVMSNGEKWLVKDGGVIVKVE